MVLTMATSVNKSPIDKTSAANNRRLMRRALAQVLASAVQSDGRRLRVAVGFHFAHHSLGLGPLQVGALRLPPEDGENTLGPAEGPVKCLVLSLAPGDSRRRHNISPHHATVELRTAKGTTRQEKFSCSSFSPELHAHKRPFKWKRSIVRVRWPSSRVELQVRPHHIGAKH